MFRTITPQVKCGVTIVTLNSSNNIIGVSYFRPIFSLILTNGVPRGVNNLSYILPTPSKKKKKVQVPVEMILLIIFFGMLECRNLWYNLARILGMMDDLFSTYGIL